MKPFFADTSYYLGLLNRDDQLHERAVHFTEAFDSEMLTTAWVLSELGNAMARPGNRDVYVSFVKDLKSDPRVTLVPPTKGLFDLGFELFADRPDKSWSLTDCISFAVMRQWELTDAVTNDRHFAQAGFRTILTPERGD